MVPVGGPVQLEGRSEISVVEVTDFEGVRPENSGALNGLGNGQREGWGVSCSAMQPA